MTNEKGIQALAELKDKLSGKKEFVVSREILENICYYCEHQGIYDKLGNYGDFYYKVKKILENS